MASLINPSTNKISYSIRANSIPDDSSSHSHETQRVNELFKGSSNSNGPMNIVFKFLSLRDGARAAGTSQLFYENASARFRQLLKKDINRDEIKKPIRHFKQNPGSREFYVTFDNDGNQYVKGLIIEKLPNYTIRTKITLLHTATNIDDLIKHLQQQIERYPDININGLPFYTKEAIESFRMFDEVKGLPELQAHTLSLRGDLKRADVWGLSDNWQNDFLGLYEQQANALSLRDDLKRADVEGLFDCQAYALSRRDDLKRADVEGLYEQQANALSLRDDLKRADVEGLSYWQAFALRMRDDLKRADVEGLLDCQAHALRERSDLKRADVEGLPNWQVRVLSARDDFKRADVEGLFDWQAYALKFRDDLKLADVEGLSIQQAYALEERRELKRADVWGLSYWQAFALRMRDGLKRADVERLYPT